jgi:hypothetical protein
MYFALVRKEYVVCFLLVQLTTLEDKTKTYSNVDFLGFSKPNLNQNTHDILHLFLVNNLDLMSFVK